MRSISLALSMVCWIAGVSGVSRAGYTPPPDDERSRGQAASGTRGGCSVELGEISLVAKNPSRLETSRERPTLLYRVAIDTPTDFLLTVADREDRQVFEYGVRLTPGPSRVVAVTLDRLKVGQKYLITAGLVCTENEESTKVIVSKITRDERKTPTELDILARRYFAGEISPTSE